MKQGYTMAMIAAPTQKLHSDVEATQTLPNPAMHQEARSACAIDKTGCLAASTCGWAHRLAMRQQQLPEGGAMAFKRKLKRQA